MTKFSARIKNILSKLKRFRFASLNSFQVFKMDRQSWWKASILKKYICRLFSRRSSLPKERMNDQYPSQPIQKSREIQKDIVESSSFRKTKSNKQHYPTKQLDVRQQQPDINGLGDHKKRVRWLTEASESRKEKQKKLQIVRSKVYKLFIKADKAKIFEKSRFSPRFICFETESGNNQNNTCTCHSFWSIQSFKKSVIDRSPLDKSGCYVIMNLVTKYVYVGESTNICARMLQHFYINHNNQSHKKWGKCEKQWKQNRETGNCEIYNDYYLKKNDFSIMFFSCKNKQEQEDMESWLVPKFKAYMCGYNKTHDGKKYERRRNNKK